MAEAFCLPLESITHSPAYTTSTSPHSHAQHSQNLGQSSLFPGLSPLFHLFAPLQSCIIKSTTAAPPLIRANDRSQYVSVNARVEDGRQDVYMAPVVLRSGIQRNGRADLERKSKENWKSFKMRSEANLRMADAHSRSYLQDSYHRSRSYHEYKQQHEAMMEAESHRGSSSEGKIAKRRKKEKMQYRLELAERPSSLGILEQGSRHLQAEAEHYVAEFERVEDFPRRAAAAKHRVYSNSARRMSSLNLQDSDLTVDSHIHLLQQHNTLLDEARAAHYMKEASVWSKKDSPF
ncbi:hypothetical protein CBS101457_005105 [Exobasidium rhododendri]|nr:hypothetical protein CBS101457_005105 [Exobasidium rhododendri]